jgi:hypothetical protein
MQRFTTTSAQSRRKLIKHEQRATKRFTPIQSNDAKIQHKLVEAKNTISTKSPNPTTHGNKSVMKTSRGKPGIGKFGQASPSEHIHSNAQASK